MLKSTQVMSTTQEKILIVDDELDILEFLKYNFEKEGYAIWTANNGLKAISKAKKHNPELIILDVMMPEMDGIEVCRLLREIPQFKSTIIIFLTARSEDYTEIAGFDAGADDYVTKPIRPRALLMRVKALLKRKKVQETEVESIRNLGELTIDMEKRQILIKEKKVALPKKEFELLILLASKPEKVFSRAEIYRNIWGTEIIVGDRTLDVHIRKLRKNIGDKYIKTTKGIGYAFKYSTK